MVTELWGVQDFWGKMYKNNQKSITQKPKKKKETVIVRDTLY